MRKITQDALDAFTGCYSFKRDNTQVVQCQYTGLCLLKLHGSTIARYHMLEGMQSLEITDAGWQTSTTKERLNALQGVSITQKNWVWYLNGTAWDGAWTNVFGEE